MATPRNFSRDRGTAASIFSMYTDVTHSTVFSEGELDNFSYDTRYQDILEPQREDSDSDAHYGEGQQPQHELPSLRPSARRRRASLALGPPTSFPSGALPESETLPEELIEEPEQYYLSYAARAAQDQHEQGVITSRMQSPSWDGEDSQDAQPNEIASRNTESFEREGSTIIFDTSVNPATSEVPILGTLKRTDLHRIHALLVLDGKDNQQPEGVVDLRTLPADFFCDGDKGIREWLAPEGHRIVLPPGQDDNNIWSLSPKGSSSSSPRLQLVTPGRVQAEDRMSTYSEQQIDLDEADPQLTNTANEPSSPPSAEDLSGPIPITPPLRTTTKQGKAVAEPGIRQCMEEDLLQNIDIYDLDLENSSINSNIQRAKPLRAKRGNEQFHPEYLRRQGETVHFRAEVESFTEYMERNDNNLDLTRAERRLETADAVAPPPEAPPPTAGDLASFSEAEAARSFPTRQPFLVHQPRSRTATAPAVPLETRYQAGASGYRQPTVEDEVTESVNISDSHMNVEAHPHRIQRENHHDGPPEFPREPRREPRHEPRHEPRRGYHHELQHEPQRGPRREAHREQYRTHEQRHEQNRGPNRERAPPLHTQETQNVNPRPFVHARPGERTHPSPPVPTVDEGTPSNIPFNPLIDSAFASARFPRPPGWVATHQQPAFQQIEMDETLPPSQRPSDIRRRTRQMQEQLRQGLGIDGSYGGFSQVRSDTHPDERVQTRRAGLVLPPNYEPLLPEEHRLRTPVLPFPEYIQPPTTLNPASQPDENGRSEHGSRSENGRRSSNGRRSRKGSAKEVLKALKFWKRD